MQQQRIYGRVREVLPVPNLRDMQVASFRSFLQLDRPPHKRQATGLEALLSETFPIESYDKKLVLEYLGYDLARPRYGVDECRKLRLTFGMPWKIRVRLRRAGGDGVEEDVYLGDMPKMIGGGEFIVNGAERVIVSQLHRSPGVDFSDEQKIGQQRTQKARIVPERGAWISLEVGKRDTLQIKIDRSGKFPATSFLRCFSPEYGTDSALLRVFYPTQVVALDGRASLDAIQQRVAVETIVDPESGETLVEAGESISPQVATAIRFAGIASVEVITEVESSLILDTIRGDMTKTHEDALSRLYTRLRPGFPVDVEKAQNLFIERFQTPLRYSLGKVGRFRLNRKFGIDRPVTESDDDLLLGIEDLLRIYRYLVERTLGRGKLDDIDHLGNRRVRTIGELCAEELRRGLSRTKRTAQERMALLDDKKLESATPRSLLHHTPVAQAITSFFGRGELSQIVDQTNPLSQLTHERRLSALGPGGLNRKRAGFDVRDVHISHYGRICPIETPEGANIGLINSLALFAGTDEYGFLVSPYRVFKRARFTGEVRQLRADEEEGVIVAPADTEVDPDGRIVGDHVLARLGGEFVSVPSEDVELMDVSPKQLVSLSAALIPFLEHDDANRALMGSNMQRQAVPLLIPDPPLVATGLETIAAANAALVVTAEEAGTVERVTATEVVVGDRTYELEKFRKLSEKTCQNQQPCVQPGQRVEKGEVLADGAATKNGELALGQNVLCAFMTFDGYNFEDAILISDRLVRDDTFTSIHIEEFEVEVRDTENGKEEVTSDVPNLSRKALSKLDERGIVKIGAHVRPGDILVGKVAPKTKAQLTPEEKLLHAIFGRMGEEVSDESLEVPPGTEGFVIDAIRFARKAHLTDEARRKLELEVRLAKADAEHTLRGLAEEMVGSLERLLAGPILLEGGAIRLHPEDLLTMEAREIRAQLGPGRAEVPTRDLEVFLDRVERFCDRIEAIEVRRDRQIERLTKGDQLKPGVLELVKVYVAQKRKITVGDKMAGRHGNKGVIARVMPSEDMPFLEDGTPVDILLNPLGVPSRMNVGQILETHLGWAARTLGFQAITPVFDGTTEDEIHDVLEEAGLPRSGKIQLFDGRTGEPFGQETTVGVIYMLKLHHMVDDKIHARSTGPYSMITQQPLGGKARFGGQRFGEMEVWALEAYGAANILQELLTVKSDDVDGRARIYESMVKGRNLLESGTPVSFNVLTNEIKGLCLNLELRGAANGAEALEGEGATEAATATAAATTPAAVTPLPAVRPPDPPIAEATPLAAATAALFAPPPPPRVPDAGPPPYPPDG